MNVTEAGVSTPKIEERLHRTRITSHAESHLRVRDQNVCRRCILRPCMNVCPAGTYDYDEEQGLLIDHEKCLECGSCRIVCEFNNMDWGHPPGAFGVDYRRG